MSKDQSKQIEQAIRARPSYKLYVPENGIARMEEDSHGAYVHWIDIRQVLRDLLSEQSPAKRSKGHNAEQFYESTEPQPEQLYELDELAEKFQALSTAKQKEFLAWCKLPEPQPEQPEAESEAGEWLLGAIARGWCSLGNEHKEMDVALAKAIADEVQKALERNNYGR